MWESIDQPYLKLVGYSTPVTEYAKLDQATIDAAIELIAPVLQHCSNTSFIRERYNALIAAKSHYSDKHQLGDDDSAAGGQSADNSSSVGGGRRNGARSTAPGHVRDGPFQDVMTQRIEEYISNGLFPSKIKDAKLMAVSERSTSVLNGCGVRLIDGDGCQWFVCLMDKCFPTLTKPGFVAIKCNKVGTSNGTKHVNDLHKVKSDKTSSQQSRLASIASQLDLSLPSFKNDPERWFHINLAAWSASQSISYNAFESDRWRLIARQLPVGAEGMKHINLRKLHIELYVSGRQFIIDKLKHARAMYQMPFLSINLDLIKSKTSNEKFVALRTNMNSIACLNDGYNLAVRRFNPSLEERQNDKLSNILDAWAEAVLEEFGIVIARDVLTAVSDSGSDVKRALVTKMGTLWEWCVSHFSHLALTDAFGTSQHPGLSKNMQARMFFKKIRKVIESVNKSEALQASYQAAMLESFAVYLKLINAPQHRWASTAAVLERLLLFWDEVRQAHRDNRREFPLSDQDRRMCVEAYSLIKPVRDIQVLAQTMKTLVTIDVYVALYHLYDCIINIERPLPILQPHRRRLGAVDPVPFERNHIELLPSIRDTRLQMREAFERRYFDRYHPKRALRKPDKVYGNHRQQSVGKPDLKFQYLFDMQAFMFPPLTSLKLLRKLINASDIADEDIADGWTADEMREHHFNLVSQYIWATISDLAERVAEALLKRDIGARSGDQPAARQPAPSAKRLKTNVLLARALDLSDEDDVEIASSKVARTAVEVVNAERQTLLAINKKDWPRADEADKWWADKAQTQRMPCLAQTALALLACKPSSGGLECDLGSMSDVLAPKRSSLRAGLTEVNLFLKINKHLMPTDPKDVCKLDKAWESHVPRRPTIALYETEDDDEDDNEDPVDGYGSA